MQKQYFLKKYIYEKLSLKDFENPYICKSRQYIFFYYMYNSALSWRKTLRCTKDEFSGKLIIQPQILFKNLNE